MPKDYEIGYGKPPKKNQWQTGQSGNPAGKPKGAKGSKPLLEYIAMVLMDEVEVSIKGKKQMIPMGKAFAMSLLNSAMSAPPKVKLEIIAMMKKLGVLDLQALLIDEQEAEPEIYLNEEERRLLAFSKELLACPDDDSF
jgi:hypothetical protein